MDHKKSLIENLVEWCVYSIIAMSIFMDVVAIFSTDVAHEAPVGSFAVQDFNQDWILEMEDGTRGIIQLPFLTDFDGEEVFVITNTLPDNLQDNSSLMFRANIEDVYVYIDGKLRSEYSTESIPFMSYYIPSAYVVTKLSSEDASKEITIKIRAKVYGIINEIKLGDGNNVWFNVIYQNIPVNLAAEMILSLGIILLALSLIFSKTNLNNRLVFYLSLLMIDISIWMFAESMIRQLIFAKTTMIQYFSYSSMELVGVLACMYFDEVQHKYYHKFYFIAELVGTIVIALNFTLHFAGLVELFKSLPVAHLIMVLSLLMSVCTLVNDVRIGRIKEYRVVAVGMDLMLATCGMEIIAFYTTENHAFGLFACIGLVCLMITTVVQILVDWTAETKLREAERERATVNTIKTIAGTIDAKDEYTGGHSERVGYYASILAREMAADYDFTEEDIERIKYIGNMHDIGKIGVPDSVLNKTERLNDEEYEIIKKHVEIGSAIMDGMDSTIQDLKDGIRYHHERFDGKGYPDGLKETEIPLVARIICLADCYDAMTSDRVYRKRLDDETVRAEILRCAGTQFDPALAEIFVRLLDRGDMKAVR